MANLIPSPPEDAGNMPAQMSDEVKPAVVYLSSLRSDLSKKTQRSALNVVAHAMGFDSWLAVDWRKLDAANLPAIMARVDGAPAQRNRLLAALTGVARSAWAAGDMTTDAYQRLLHTSKHLRDTGTREIAGRELTPDEVRRLVDVCRRDAHPAGKRDAALIAIAASTGARRGEIVKMRIPDLVLLPDNKGAQVKIIGKGNKQRTTPPITGDLWKVVKDWLSFRGGGEWLITPMHRAGIPLDKPLTVNSADEVLTKRAAEAGITNITWHDFRRTAATILIREKGVHVAQRVLGHAAISTTARYDRSAADEALNAASQALAAVYDVKDGDANGED